jgi:hypothetical protein
MATTTAQSLARLKFDTVDQLASGFNKPVNVDIPQSGVSTTWAAGTGAGQVNLGWADQRTLVATSVTLDVSALAAAATNTGAATFAALKGVLIRNESTSTGNLTIGNAASVQAPFNGVGGTETVVLKPGGEYLFTDPSAAGQVVTTNKNLKLDAGASTCLVTTVLIGLD